VAESLPCPAHMSYHVPCCMPPIPHPDRRPAPGFHNHPQAHFRYHRNIKVSPSPSRDPFHGRDRIRPRLRVPTLRRTDPPGGKPGREVLHLKTDSRLSRITSHLSTSVHTKAASKPHRQPLPSHLGWATLETVASLRLRNPHHLPPSRPPAQRFPTNSDLTARILHAAAVIY
jgi:hypothetical protein